ncbi:hypothetical protein D3C75_938900 [compost metagenome]
MQHRRGDDEGAEEPVAHVDVLGLAAHHGAEEHHGVGDPDDGHHHRAGELDLGILLGGGVAQWQADQHDGDHRLPAPEGEGDQRATEQAGLAGALYRVVGGGEQPATAEGEDHQAGVQRAQAAEAGPFEVEVEGGPHQLRGDEHPHGHADHAPDHGHHGKLAHDSVVVRLLGIRCAHVETFLLNKSMATAPRGVVQGPL